MMMSKAPPARDREELEGTLLPIPLLPPPIPVPLATPVTGPISNATLDPVATAVPCPFEISSSENRTTPADPPSPDLEADGVNEDVPTAPFLPTYEDTTPASRARDDAERIRLGHAIGKIAADEEKTGINRAKRDVYSAQYRTANAVKAANKEARRRDREGFDIKEDKWFRDDEQNEGAEGGTDPYTVPYSKKGGGYEVSEYDVTEYDTQEYETREYKSVYDT